MPKLNMGGSGNLAGEGKHKVKLVEVREVPNGFFNRNTDPIEKETQYEWIFEDETGTQVRTWSNKKLSTYKGKPSKALTIVEALVGKKLGGKEREEFRDTDRLLDKYCVVNVEHVENRDGETRAKIVGFSPDSTSEEEDEGDMPF